MNDEAQRAAERLRPEWNNAVTVIKGYCKDGRLTEAGVAHFADIIRQEYAARIKKLEEELFFWTGQYEDKCPLIIEWRKLLQKPDRTTADSYRMGELADQMRIASEEEPELRLRIAGQAVRTEKLEAVMKRAEHLMDQLDGPAGNLPCFMLAGKEVRLLRAALDAAKDLTNPSADGLLIELEDAVNEYTALDAAKETK